MQVILKFRPFWRSANLCLRFFFFNFALKVFKNVVRSPWSLSMHAIPIFCPSLTVSEITANLCFCGHPLQSFDLEICKYLKIEKQKKNYMHYKFYPCDANFFCPFCSISYGFRVLNLDFIKCLPQGQFGSDGYQNTDLTCKVLRQLRNSSYEN